MKLLFSMKYVPHFFLNEGHYFLSEKWRSGVECMGQGGIGTVERLRKEKKDRKINTPTKNILLGCWAFVSS